MDTIDQHAAFDQLFGELSDIPKQNVMQRLMQALTQQIAQAQHFSDRIQLGDDPVMDAKGQRPSPDGHEGRVLSEKQHEYVLRAADDEDAAVTALLELKAIYEAWFGEAPQYSLAQNKQGEWKPITDFSKAVAHEYREAHKRFEAKQANQQAQSEKGKGAAFLAAQRRESAASKAAQL